MGPIRGICGVWGIRYGRVLCLGCAVGLGLLTLRGCLAARRSEPDGVGNGAAVIAVYDHREEAVRRMDLEDYVLGVTAGEMPASFPEEALKAQAVAARTYALYHMGKGGCGKTGADVCTSSACCQAYCSDARMREKWGRAYRANREKLLSAVSATAGEVLLYEGAPIDALYHSASGGRTENAGDVYTTDVPYLKSVMSTAETGTNRLAGEKRMGRKDFCALVNGKWPGAKLSAGSLEKEFTVTETLPSGRVKTVQVGNETHTGRELRSLLGLDSTLFSVSCTAEEIVFSTKGYGHGVGMSQTGANAMALGGRTYAEILLYYYTDVTLGRMAG